MPTITTMFSSRGSAARWASPLRRLDIATARTFVERDRGQHVRTQRELAGLAQDPPARVDQLGFLEHDKLDRARAGLARGEVTGDLRSGVVLDHDPMTDEVVELRVIRHRSAPYITAWAPVGPVR